MKTLDIRNESRRGYLFVKVYFDQYAYVSVWKQRGYWDVGVDHAWEPAKVSWSSYSCDDLAFAEAFEVALHRALEIARGWDADPDLYEREALETEGA